MNELRGTFAVELPDGTKLTSLVNLYTLQRFTKEHSLTLDALDEALKERMLESLPSLIWHGVETHHALAGTEVETTKQRFLILFGSVDWAPYAAHVATALNLEDDSQKKRKPKAPRASR